MISALLNLIYWQSKRNEGSYPLAIIYYHHVFAKKEAFHPDDLDQEQFEKQVAYLQKHFNILSIGEALDLLAKKRLPPRALVLTFDDGYADNYTVAAPILEKYGCPATIFVSTEGIEVGTLWNDRVEQLIKATSKDYISDVYTGNELALETEELKVQAFQALLSTLKFLSNDSRTKLVCQLELELGEIAYNRTMMTADHIRNLNSELFTIGAHTHHHTILTTEDDESSSQELKRNKDILENITKRTVDIIAFPNGLYGRDYKAEHCDIAKTLGFKAGFSTNDGGAISTTNPYTIPRFMPYRKQLPLFALSIAKIAGEHV